MWRRNMKMVETASVSSVTEPKMTKSVMMSNGDLPSGTETRSDVSLP